MQNWNSENGTKRKPGRHREDVDVLVSLLQLDQASLLPAGAADTESDRRCVMTCDQYSTVQYRCVGDL